MPRRGGRLPYGRQQIGPDDVAAVVAALESDWLTTGPRVGEFEEAFARYVGCAHAVAVSSGTAGLHAAMFALGIDLGDEVIVPTMTFAASANCVVYQGGTPVFVDVDPGTLLVDPAQVETAITPRTRAIVAVDYAGQPCDYGTLGAIAARHGLPLVADACHSVGASDRGKAVGTLAALSVFSFHPVKHLTTGEGGMVTTDDSALAARLRLFRNHGIASDHRERDERAAHHYEMVELGFNYRLTDLQCALGLSQLAKLPAFLARRREIAKLYDRAFASRDWVRPLAVRSHVEHAYHLYVVRVDPAGGGTRDEVFQALRRENVAANVHYVPVHLHPYYRRRFGTGPGSCPVAEAAYEQVLSLPMFPGVADDDVDHVVEAIDRVVARPLAARP